MASYIDDVFTSDVFEDAIYTGVFTDTIFEVNIKNKLIYLNAGVRTYNPITDIYVELRYHRANNESIRRLSMPIKASGNLPKGGGIFTGRLSTFYNGWKVVPADDADHTLTITGEQIDGLGLNGVGLVDKTNLVHSVDVVYSPPPSSEIIQVDTGSGVTEQDKNDIIAGVWANVTRTLTSSGSITDADIHSGLDTYLNKDTYKSIDGMTPAQETKLDSVITKLATTLLANVKQVNDVNVLSIDDFKADITTIVSGNDEILVKVASEGQKTRNTVIAS